MAGGIDTIACHKAVLKSKGYVWIGKIGRALKVGAFQSQIDAGVRTYLYLAKPTPTGFEFTRGDLLAVQAGRPTVKKDGIPPYYATSGFLAQIGMWMLVSGMEAVEDTERKTLITRSSGRAISDTLQASSAGAFVVVRGGSPLRDSSRGARSSRQSLQCELDDEFDFEDRGLFDDV